MSVIVKKSLRCNGYKCEEKYDCATGDIYVLRSYAALKSWTNHAELDYCPECSKTQNVRKEFK